MQNRFESKNKPISQQKHTNKNGNDTTKQLIQNLFKIQMQTKITHLGRGVLVGTGLHKQTRTLHMTTISSQNQ